MQRYDKYLNLQNYLPKNQASRQKNRPDAQILRRFKGFYRLIILIFRNLVDICFYKFPERQKAARDYAMPE